MERCFEGAPSAYHQITSSNANPCSKTRTCTARVLIMICKASEELQLRYTTHLVAGKASMGTLLRHSARQLAPFDPIPMRDELSKVYGD
jgi:hypothetical protein